MIAVSNTSPLIALAKIQHLFILQGLFKQVLLPAVVADEFLLNCMEAEERDFQACHVLNIVTEKFGGTFTRTLDAGERAVLGLALQRNIETVLIDDRKAFNEAKEQGLMPISTRALLQASERRRV
ncbi:MAG: hypothetical protein GY862_02245, partial [Gammaproteobacteria bacterium]|nr:hypothetical protein [Gammaproteobacteria bacterium]